MDEPTSPQQGQLTEWAADIVAAYVSNNSIPVAEMPALIAATYAALVGLDRGTAAEPAIEKPTPAQIKRSITQDALVSFVDGKPYKTLKRHLGTHGLTFEAYRERYGLPLDYPAVAPSYSEARSALARSLGLGRPRREAAPETPAETETESDAPKARKPRTGRRTAAE
ncbi:MucR family transcriptional regulator [Methylobacterium sp. NEAU 140]|uniref:MucR family transcriptional regulator n=1 Tax=Methylobacterium sp. NEAU 140 TaxID=3064945 RepID=UPI0027352C6C|nr:MucR family transcriptional regulator [Methylobacterium sp. NEAU 140]MDP4023586.1 MucR family transcriptional regulator [Methylobacterium sp. NEAU 140]